MNNFIELIFIQLWNRYLNHKLAFVVWIAFKVYFCSVSCKFFLKHDDFLLVDEIAYQFPEKLTSYDHSNLQNPPLDLRKHVYILFIIMKYV